MVSDLAFIGAKRVATWHSAFGAPSPKPFQLWSSNDIVYSLRRGKPQTPPLAEVLSSGRVGHTIWECIEIVV